MEVGDGVVGGETYDANDPEVRARICGLDQHHARFECDGLAIALEPGMMLIETTDPGSDLGVIGVVGLPADHTVPHLHSVPDAAVGGSPVRSQRATRPQDR